MSNFSCSQAFLKLYTPFGKHYVYQVPLDCNHEHNNLKCSYNCFTYTIKFPYEDTLEIRVPLEHLCAPRDTGTPIWEPLFHLTHIYSATLLKNPQTQRLTLIRYRNVKITSPPKHHHTFPHDSPVNNRIATNLQSRIRPKHCPTQNLLLSWAAFYLCVHSWKQHTWVKKAIDIKTTHMASSKL